MENINFRPFFICQKCLKKVFFNASFNKKNTLQRVFRLVTEKKNQN